MVASDKKRSIDVKVILAARLADREVIERELRGASAASFEVLEIPPLTREEMTEVARLEFPALTENAARLLARHFGSNLFLLRAAVQLIRQGLSPAKITETGRVRSLVAQRFLSEATSRLSALCDGSQTHQLLLRTALDVPVHAGAASLEQTALREAGLLRVVGETLRFRADVEGDVVLGYLLEQAWARAWLERNLREPPESTLIRVRNLASAGGGHPEQAIRRICQEWATIAGGTGKSERSRILQVLPHCVQPAPEEVIALCGAYARTMSTHTTDDFGPTVIALARAGKQIEALRLLRSLKEAGVASGTYANYKFDGATREVASLAYLSPRDAEIVCDEVSRWLDEEALPPAMAELVQVVVENCLAPVAR